ncbi:DNA cytosine methyltransferase [Clostridium magnum]|uniref:Cytosine-specific methyltransferase n=1 Tax=Clostridium magnum DSM 2767 TaxID=1121326 RepID=A0A161Y6J3_9CLOT|nr:DNA cytosine methyltransferase [Clostridium magnum]KZL93939.1 modification methylase HaeIII [Clostridium magnum DSM 2767]SHH98968.1 DNA (cytosine-5)-methyltransferase 1 [Clostridium magnum DSM 2767]
MKKYTTIDLFAGAGGLSYGFQETGKFDIKIAVEHNKHAQETYKKNHPGAEIESDITQITNGKYKSIKEKYGDIDIIIGGPPCQGFSNANRQKNELICGNNQLVNEYIRAVEQLKPKAFVMENVKMINSSKHKFFCSDKDKRTVEKLGVCLQEEIITIAEATICTDEFIDFLKQEDVLGEYLLEQQNYIKINTIYRNSKTSKQLEKYLENHEKSIEKILNSWDDFKLNFWSKEYEEVFLETKERLNTFLTSDDEFEKLRDSLKIIIETQKAIYKMKEIRDYNITLIGMVAEKSNICIIVNTYNIIEYVLKKFRSMGYIVECGVLNAVNYGVPQSRERFIIIGVKNEYLKSDKVELPQPILKSPDEFYTIRDAIADLAQYQTTVMVESKPIQKDIKEIKELNPLQKYLNKGELVYNHVITDTRDTALERFRNLQPGQNFHNLSENLKTTYSDPSRTQNTIYLRLKYGSPSGTVLNARKSMWIHPEKDRAISIREVARLQSFPDTFVFCGTKDAQYQQIGNAVPPLLGRVIAEKLLELLGDETNEKLIDIIVKK